MEHASRIVLRSPRFVLHTDLTQQEAEQTLDRMEAALKAAAEYWQCKPRRQIACYVVKDPSKWPDSAFPHPLARVWVGGVGGATISQFEKVGGRRRVTATVYADAKPGIVEHEVIHAYCYHAFGEAGPDWYKEGMAQAVAQWAATEPHHGCPPELVRILRNEVARKIPEIVQAGRFTNDLSESFGAMLSDRKIAGHVPLSDWTTHDVENL
ncbi:MAG: hypothetical protein JJ992_00905, partial [Planctomycetes bacterium]|nr:hypothetical protein [Planctomycetota bacterium]